MVPILVFIPHSCKAESVHLRYVDDSIFCTRTYASFKARAKKKVISTKPVQF